MRLKISIPESSIITKGSGHHDKVILVSNDTIPQTMSEHDSISRTIRRKGLQDTWREIPDYTDPIYRPPPKPTEIHLQVIPGRLTDLDIDAKKSSKGNTFTCNCKGNTGRIFNQHIL